MPLFHKLMGCKLKRSKILKRTVYLKKDSEIFTKDHK